MDEKEIKNAKTYDPNINRAGYAHVPIGQKVEPIRNFNDCHGDDGKFCEGSGGGGGKGVSGDKKGTGGKQYDASTPKPGSGWGVVIADSNEPASTVDEDSQRIKGVKEKGTPAGRAATATHRSNEKDASKGSSDKLIALRTIEDLHQDYGGLPPKENLTTWRTKIDTIHMIDRAEEVGHADPSDPTGMHPDYAAGLRATIADSDEYHDVVKPLHDKLYGQGYRPLKEEPKTKSPDTLGGDWISRAPFQPKSERD